MRILNLHLRQRSSIPSSLRLLLLLSDTTASTKMVKKAPKKDYSVRARGGAAACLRLQRQRRARLTRALPTLQALTAAQAKSHTVKELMSIYKTNLKGLQARALRLEHRDTRAYRAARPQTNFRCRVCVLF